MALCKSCEGLLSTGIEIKLDTCVACIEKVLKESAALKDECIQLQKNDKESKDKLETIQKILNEVALQKTAEKEGQMAQSKGASMDDNPYDKDSDNGSCWSYGWLSSEIMFTVRKMQAVMLFSVNMLSVVREVAAGGAPGDEIVAKLDTVIEKIAPYITPEE